MSRTIDLSEEIYPGMKHNPRNTPFVLWPVLTHENTKDVFEDGLTYATNGFMIGEQTTTHLDALSCCDPDDESVEQMSLDLFWGPGTCIDISHMPPQARCNAAQIEEAVERCGADVRPGDVLLIRTGAEAHSDQYPGIDGSATNWIIDQGIKIFGIDAESPDTWLDKHWDSHVVCRDRHMAHYEHLTNLGQLVGKRFTFYGFPLRIRGGTGSPVRAVAVLDD